MTIHETSNVASSQLLRVQRNDESSVSVITPTLASTVKDVKQLSPEELKASVDKINQELKQNHVNLDFSIDKNTHVSVVKVTDASTGDIIMQFPSKAVLAISEAVVNSHIGAFLEDNA